MGNQENMSGVWLGGCVLSRTAPYLFWHPMRSTQLQPGKYPCPRPGHTDRCRRHGMGCMQAAVALGTSAQARAVRRRGVAFGRKTCACGTK